MVDVLAEFARVTQFLSQCDNLVLALLDVRYDLPSLDRLRPKRNGKVGQECPANASPVEFLLNCIASLEVSNLLGRYENFATAWAEAKHGIRLERFLRFSSIGYLGIQRIYR